MYAIVKTIELPDGNSSWEFYLASEGAMQRAGSPQHLLQQVSRQTNRSGYAAKLPLLLTDYDKAIEVFEKVCELAVQDAKSGNKGNEYALIHINPAECFVKSAKVHVNITLETTTAPGCPSTEAPTHD